jgi:hypothetical protein
METPLICQTATPLQNGMILIAGGANSSGAKTTAEIYNPSTIVFADWIIECCQKLREHCNSA